MAQGVHLRPVPSTRDRDYGGQVGAEGMGLSEKMVMLPAQSPRLPAFLIPASPSVALAKIGPSLSGLFLH